MYNMDEQKVVEEILKDDGGLDVKHAIQVAGIAAKKKIPCITRRIMV